MNDYSRVKIPDMKGVHIKKAGQKRQPYVYLMLTGQSGRKSISIGKVCEDDPTMMVPNGNYYSYCAKPNEDGLWDFGFTFLFYKMAEDARLTDILWETVGEDAALALLAAAACKIATGRDPNGMEVWAERVWLPSGTPVCSRDYMDFLLSRLNEHVRRRIFARWIEENGEDETICYDVESLSPYDDPESDWKLKLSGVEEALIPWHMCCFSSREKRIPLYAECHGWRLDEGSNLGNIVENASLLGLKNLHLLAEGSYFNSKDFRLLRGYFKSFTVRMPLDKKKSRELIDRVFPRTDWQYMEFKETVYGVKGRVLIFYDEEMAEEERLDLEDVIDYYREELESTERYPGKRKYEPYFIVTRHEDDMGFDFSLNDQKVEEMRKSQGFSLFFTTNDFMTPEEILSGYKEKDEMQELYLGEFAWLTWGYARPLSPEASEGKGLVTFLGSIIKSKMQNALSSYLEEQSMTVGYAIDSLSYLSLAREGNRYYLVNPSPEQKGILEAMDAYDSMIRYVEALNS